MYYLKDQIFYKHHIQKQTVYMAHFLHLMLERAAKNVNVQTALL